MYRYARRCIASSFYIKPQPHCDINSPLAGCIASSFYIKPQLEYVQVIISVVVLHPLSTSNHNTESLLLESCWLYCILFLHQTTTTLITLWRSFGCIASSFYIKPQQKNRSGTRMRCCIASSFYIKPQHTVTVVDTLIRCIASSFYIKPQRSPLQNKRRYSCIASSFYIKPQPVPWLHTIRRVVLHPLSTSNHNWAAHWIAK